MILIVSFNARPIAQLAKEMGLDIAVVDFWRDQDIFRFSNKVYTVFKPEFKTYSAFPDQHRNEELLVALALEVTNNFNIDSILIGSGLDDRPDLWEKLNSAAPILGNTPECIKNVRNIMQIQSILLQHGLKVPKTILLKEFLEQTNQSSPIHYPVILKPKETLGGIGIKLLTDPFDFSKFVKKFTDYIQNYYIQEYIEGENISTTMVGNQKNYKLLSINKQLIGIKKLGTNLPFKYCGNIIPYICPLDIAQKIEEAALKIANLFSLNGVFGIDFVLKDGNPYFMEINPRFPGTIELLYPLTRINAVQCHLNAIQGILPTQTGRFHGYAMKCILFAKKEFETPHLESISHLSDIPSPGILLKPEDPIGTLTLFDENMEMLQKRMDLLINQIYKKAS